MLKDSLFLLQFGVVLRVDHLRDAVPFFIFAETTVPPMAVYGTVPAVVLQKAAALGLPEQTHECGE